MLLIIALPVAVALLLLPLRRVRYLAAGASSLTLLAFTGLVIGQSQSVPIVIMGRSVGLSPLVSAVLCGSALALTCCTLHSFAEPTDTVAYSVVLATMGLLAAGLMLRNVTLAGLLLLSGALLAIVLIPLRRPALATYASRALVVLVLTSPMLLLGVRGLEGGGTEAAQRALVALGIVLCVGTAAFPFHVWLTPLIREGTCYAVVMLAGVLGLALTAYLRNITYLAPGTGDGSPLATLLLFGGLATCAFGGLAALTQRRASAVLAYAALSDLGVVLVGLGLPGQPAAAVATLHGLYRVIALTAIAIGVSVWRATLAGDDEYRVRGAVAQAPLTTVGVTLAGLSLAGLPFTAGFSTRLLLVGALAGLHPGYAAVVALAAAGPLWAFLRMARSAFAPIQFPGERREPLISGALVLLLGLVLLVLGVGTALLPVSPLEWLAAGPGA